MKTLFKFVEIYIKLSHNFKQIKTLTKIDITFMKAKQILKANHMKSKKKNSLILMKPDKASVKLHVNFIELSWKL